MTKPTEVKEFTVCRCMEVSNIEIKDAIANGARSFDSVKKATKAGMGLCQGRVCEQLIELLITEVTGVCLNDLPSISVRPPIRPAKLKALAEVQDEWL